MLSREVAEEKVKQFKNKHISLYDTPIATIMYKENLGDNFKNLDHDFKGGYLPKDDIIIIVISEHKNLKDLETTLKHETYGHHALYRIDKEEKRELLHSIRKLKNDVEVKPYWEHVNNEYPKLDLNQKAEEVFSYIVEKSEVGLKMVKPINFDAKSLSDIKNVSYNLQNKYLQTKMEQQIKPEENHKQFRVVKEKSFKQQLEKKRERTTSQERGIER